MVRDSSVSHIKRARKESALYRIISEAVAHVMRDDPMLRDFFVTKVQLTSDGGTCRVFFHAERGAEYFSEQLKRLILYKPSIRAFISREMPRRLTPEVEFVFDKTFAKIARIEQLIDTVSHESDAHDE